METSSSGAAIMNPWRRAWARMRSAPAGFDATLFVWSCWLVMSVMAVLYVARYGGNMPFMDEFAMVPVYTHVQPVTVGFLWAQHNEHRIPLPKLIEIGLMKISAMDFRAGMYFNVALMSLSAAWLIGIAKGIRGRASYADAFFPLVLLNWGNYENFLWSFQVAFSVSTFLACAVLASLVGRGREAVFHDNKLALRPALLASLCLILLPLCGAQGALLAPPVALWLAFVGFRAWVSGRFRDWKGAVVAAAALSACLLVGGYFVGYSAPSYHLAPPNLRAWMRTSSEFLLTGFGPAIGELRVYGVVCIGALSLVALFVLLAAWKSLPRERLGVAGFLCFLAGMAALALGIGKGRAFLGPGAGLSSRYVMLSAPFILALHLGVGRWARPQVARFVQMALLLVAVGVAMGNFRVGGDYGQARRDHQRAIETAVRSGASPEAVTSQCGQFFFPDPNLFLSELKAMQQCHLGPYRLKIRGPEGR